jgi:putative addiction module component (TIGR02574 family)
MSSLAEIESAVDELPLPDQEELLQRLVRKLGSVRLEEFPVREDHLRLLEERFAAYRDDPSQASTWEEVKRRFAERRR